MLPVFPLQPIVQKTARVIDLFVQRKQNLIPLFPKTPQLLQNKIMTHKADHHWVPASLSPFSPYSCPAPHSRCSSHSSLLALPPTCQLPSHCRAFMPTAFPFLLECSSSQHSTCLASYLYPPPSPNVTSTSTSLWFSFFTALTLFVCAYSVPLKARTPISFVHTISSIAGTN